MLSVGIWGCATAKLRNGTPKQSAPKVGNENQHQLHYLEQTRMLFTISSIPSISAAQPHIHVSGKLHIFFLMHKPPNIDQLWCA